MATAKPDPKTEAKPVAPKVKKEPKPLLTRMDEQITRAVVAKRVTVDELAKFESRVGRLKLFLEE
jgi:hypothetical protein